MSLAPKSLRGRVRRRQRAPRKPRLRLWGVVATGGDVVGRVRVKERRQVLDLPAAGPELEHAAAVEAYSLALGPVVEVEQILKAAEARRLRVERARAPRKLLDVGDRMDRGIPGDAIAMRLEHGERFGRLGRVLDERFRKRRRDTAVEPRGGGRA